MPSGAAGFVRLVVGRIARARPYQTSMPLYRRQEQNAQLLDFKCVEYVEELLYGKY